MADAAKWITAAEPAFNWKGGTFLDAYAANRAIGNEIALESSVVFEPLVKFMAEQDRLFSLQVTHLGTEHTWTGTMTDLLDGLNLTFGDDKRRPKDWPNKPQSLSTELKRIAPNLRKLGVNFQKGKRGEHQRGYRLDWVRKKPSLPSLSSGSGASDGKQKGKSMTHFSEKSSGSRQESSGVSEAKPLKTLKTGPGPDNNDNNDDFSPSYSNDTTGEEEGEQIHLLDPQPEGVECDL